MIGGDFFPHYSNRFSTNPSSKSISHPDGRHGRRMQDQQLRPTAGGGLRNAIYFF